MYLGHFNSGHVVKQPMSLWLIICHLKWYIYVLPTDELSEVLLFANPQCFKIKVNFIFLAQVDHLIYGLVCWISCISSHLLLLALEDEPHIWKEVSSGNKASHKKLTLSPAILAEVPTVKSLAGQCGEVSLQSVRAQPKWIPTSIQAETFKVFEPFLNRSIWFFLIKSATQENALCVLPGDSGSSWPIV